MSCRILPEFLSTQIAKLDLPSSGAAVTQIWSPHTTGLDQPLSCSGVFHFTCSVSLHVAGNPLASEKQSPRAPRNCGQFSSADNAPQTSSSAAITKQRSMSHSTVNNQTRIIF